MTVLTTTITVQPLPDTSGMTVLTTTITVQLLSDTSGMTVLTTTITVQPLSRGTMAVFHNLCRTAQSSRVHQTESVSVMCSKDASNLSLPVHCAYRTVKFNLAEFKHH